MASIFVNGSLRTVLFGVFLVLISLLIYSHTAFAEQPSLTVQGVPLYIGLPRLYVLRQFKDYQIKCIGQETTDISTCDSLLIQASDTPFITHANVAFKDEKISSVVKYWSYEYHGSDPDKFVHALQSVLKKYAEHGMTTFKLSLAEVNEPGFHDQVIDLNSGHKTIRISHREIKDVDGVVRHHISLDEFLQ